MRKWIPIVVVFLTLSSRAEFVQAEVGRVYAEETETGAIIVQDVSQLDTLTAVERSTVQRQRLYHVLFTPTDPYWGLQWNLEAIHMPAAWDANAVPPFTGSSSIIVAVLDTGVALDATGSSLAAPDMAGAALWTNTGEIPGDGIDNDANGYIDDIHGWNFISDSNIPADDFGHGTQVTDILVGGINNARAIAGVASSTTILPLKVMDGNGIGATDTLTNGIRYAVAAGASIINLSIGGTDADPLLADAIADAQSAGVIVVAASGNDGISTLSYPALYPGVISVGATQYDATRADYANYGTGLTIVAPGGNTSLDQNGDNQVDGVPTEGCTSAACTNFSTLLVSGTSVATPQISGVLSLLLACGATPEASVSAMTATATDLGVAGYDTTYGYGLVNAESALAAVGCVSGSPAIPENVSVAASSTAQSSLVSTRAWPYTKPMFRWSSAPGVHYTLTWGVSGNSPQTISVTQSQFQPTITTAGTYLLTIRAIDQSGHTSARSTIQYRYRPSKILIGTNTSVTAFSTKGVRDRSFTGFQSLALGNGSSVQQNADDRIVVTDQQRSGLVKIFTRSGTIAQQLRIFSPTSKIGIQAAFLHQRDAVATLVVASTASGEVRWLDSSGTTKIRKVQSADKGYRIAVGDITGDGDDEVVVADRIGSRIRVFSANGTLRFTIRPRGASYQGGWVPSVGDVTGDGISEIILLPATDTANPILSVINGKGKRIKTITLRGQKTASIFSMTTGNIDGGPKDRILIHGQGSTITSWNIDGQMIRSIPIPRTVAIRSLGIWQ